MPSLEVCFKVHCSLLVVYCQCRIFLRFSKSFMDAFLSCFHLSASPTQKCRDNPNLFHQHWKERICNQEGKKRLIQLLCRHPKRARKRKLQHAIRSVYITPIMRSIQLTATPPSEVRGRQLTVPKRADFAAKTMRIIDSTDSKRMFLTVVQLLKAVLGFRPKHVKHTYKYSCARCERA